MPIATVPLSLPDAGPAYPANWAEMRSDIAELADHEADYMNCYAEHAQDAELPRRHGWRATGAQIDGGRLHLSRIARKSGLSASIFRRHRHHTERTFRPDNHLVTLGFDAQALCPGTLESPAINRKLILLMIHGFLELGVNLRVHAFWDGVAVLRSGQRVYVHQPIMIKAWDEPAVGAVWSRLSRILYVPRQAFNRSIRPCFAPVHFRTLGQALTGPTSRQSFSNYGLHYIGVGLLKLPGFRLTDEFLSRCANAIDTAHDAILEHPGTWQTACAVSKRIIARARPGGATSEMMDAFG